MVQLTVGLKFFNQPFERKMLVRISAKGDLANPSQ